MLRRREFLGTSLALTTNLAIRSPTFAATRQKKILVLGGTNYVGPHIVHSAL